MHATLPTKPSSDLPFYTTLYGFTALYAAVIILLVAASASYITWADLLAAVGSESIQQSLTLTFLTCTISAILALIFAVPIGYTLSRFRFRGHTLLDTILDIPIILPPLVVGLSLLILFNAFPTEQSSLEKWLNQRGLEVTFHIPAIIIAQFTISAAFAIRSMKNTFEQLSPRAEMVALTLGCNRAQAFWRVALPQAGRGVLAAGVLAWARALGEFGPILVFAGATRGRTEVLATSVFLEVNIGNLGGAAAVSLILITLAIATILTIRLVGDRK
ncbi:ABC transporter permease [Rubritalea spongiae]|uniref:ABC transporter permease n=1 Tax=Rubritalea spongiae TaxID=430797 RepID=A0ABW5DXB9_9BACT